MSREKPAEPVIEIPVVAHDTEPVPVPVRHFALADGDVSCVCVGANPLVRITETETFSTDDPKLAARLAADPLLEEKPCL